MMSVGASHKVADMTFEERQKQLEEIEMQEQEEIEDGKRSPYKTWAQLNLEPRVMHAVQAIAKQSAVALQIYLFIIQYMDRQNALVCSMSVFSEALKYSRQTISKAIKLLKDNNFIDVKKSGTTNVYILNNELAWKAWGTGFKYAEFNACVLIAESEQDEPDSPVTVKRRNVVDTR